MRPLFFVYDAPENRIVYFVHMICIEREIAKIYNIF